MDLGNLSDNITKIFLENKQYHEIPQDEYTSFSYPRWIKFMNFITQRYKISGYGSMMIMQTKTLFGMNLLTISFMPGEGVSIPYLLIDIMTIGKKIVTFIEYYDCTADHPDMKNLEEIYNAYKDLPEYDEKPKWYVSERTFYSLIKSGTNTDHEKFNDMIIDSVKAYNKELQKASIDERNLPGLSTLRDRMINEGNPSSSILEKIFGKEKAEDFFIKCVMPM